LREGKGNPESILQFIEFMVFHIPNAHFHLLAKTFHGLERLLADELKSIGVQNI